MAQAAPERAAMMPEHPGLLSLLERPMPDEFNLDETRRAATAIGLSRLTDEHLRQFARATRAAEQRRAALPTGRLTPADEPAHVFSIERQVGP
jgi:hypothetical protein